MKHSSFLVPPDSKSVKLSKYDSAYTSKYKNADETNDKLQKGIAKMAKLQDILYAQNTYGLLIIIQAMDAAGKDSAVKHVFSGVNPQGCTVANFKAPSAEELDHGYLWRAQREVPERGGIGIFNRSYYEEVLIARVNPHVLAKQQLPDEARGKNIWRDRFEQINAFEKYLVQNGILVLKFYLNVSKQEQKRRFLERIDNPAKNWKFAPSDVEARGLWDDYQRAYEDMFKHTTTKYAPWYIVPADNKWFTRIVLNDVITDTLEKLNLRYPEVSKEHRAALQAAKETLLKEKH
jgi:PPK2 family polyphosphate:nucleotide phosphotransferase